MRACVRGPPGKPRRTTAERLLLPPLPLPPFSSGYPEGPPLHYQPRLCGWPGGQLAGPRRGGGEAAGIRGRGRRGPGGAGLGWPRRARARPLKTRPARIPKPPRLDRCLECSKVSATFHAAEHVVIPHSAETSSALSTEELYPLSSQRHSKASSSSVTPTPAGWPRPQKAFAGSAGVAARVFLFPTD